VNKLLLGLTLLFATTSSTVASEEDGAPTIDGRFRNRAEPTEHASFGAGAGVWVRKTWQTLVPRDGAAVRVPYDKVAAARSPSLTWIGHATFLVRMDGVTFLTDPMFSNWAGPVAPFGSRRAVAAGASLEELPLVDFVLLTHDHYDHADRPSVKWLAKRGVRFVVPRGLGDWVRGAGGTAVELDWWQSVEIGGVRIHCVPAQHFSGRSLSDGDKRLWAGWVVSGSTRRFYHAGDSGYSADFKTIGERLGPIDVAAVPIGAYHPSELMHFVHTTPEEALRVGQDARAQHVVAMHFGTFDLADEPLDEPPQRFRVEAARLGLGPDRAWIMKIGETRDW
jgi:N-acyl-phosphatidylethanolamine-hydrolysing phospholipase D